MADSPETDNAPENPSQNLYAYYKFKLGRDSPSEARNTLLLVVATLIAAATFQAGVNPPGGVWQDTTTKHTAGKSVSGTNYPGAHTVFMFTNTLAFALALQVIFCLVIGCPFQIEVWIALVSMSCTYGASIASVEPSGVVSSGFLFIPYFIPCVLRLALQVMRSFK